MKLIYNIEEFEWCKRSNRLDRYGYLNEIGAKDIDRPASFIVIKGKTKNITSNKLDFKYEVIYRSVGEEVPYHLRILIDWNKL